MYEEEGNTTMNAQSSIVLTGISGGSYPFEVYALGARLPAIGVVYFVFDQVYSGAGPDSRAAIYIGQAENGETCMDEHHRHCFIAHGANFIGLHADEDEASRVQKVGDLVIALQPLCNA